MDDQPAMGRRIRYSPAELTRMLANHERHATGRGGVRVSFKGADLSGAILANRRLDEADFSGADLSGANLHGSNLRGASLFCADLTGCNLRNANLTRADMRGASFKNADLSFAVLDDADLRKATMMVMNRGDVAMIDYQKRGIGAVDFSYCSLRKTSFGKAKLDGVNFNGAILIGTSFRGADIAGASFVGAVLMDVKVEDLKQPPETFADCVFDISDAAKTKASALAGRLAAHQQWVLSDGRDGAAAVFDGEDLRPLAGKFAGHSLIGLTARGVTAIGLDFSNCQLQGAKFDGADLRGADFSGADLCGASFYGARLVHACFDHTKFGCVRLRNGDDLRPNFHGSDASPGQFRAAELAVSLGAMGIGAVEPDYEIVEL